MALTLPSVPVALVVDEEMPRTPASSRKSPASSQKSSEYADCSPSLVVKNTFIEGFDLPLDVPTRPRRSRSCPCDRSKRNHAGDAVENGEEDQAGFDDSDLDSQQDVDVTSQDTSTADEHVSSTPLGTPRSLDARSFGTLESDSTRESTPTREASPFVDAGVSVRLSEYMTSPQQVPSYGAASFSSPHGALPGWSPLTSSGRSTWCDGFLPASGFNSIPVPPPPPSLPAPGSASLPSVGSAGHASGRCKPCAFLHTKGCSNGLNCSFCHLCGPGERKFRQREKKAMAQRRQIAKARAAAQK